MKPHIPTFALIAALAMVLATVVFLSIRLQAGAGITVIALVAASVPTIVGVLGGISQPAKSDAPPLTVADVRALIEASPKQ